MASEKDLKLDAMRFDAADRLMFLNDPWKKLYENWPARNDQEALALKLLSEARSESIIEETGMSNEEFRDFMRWAREYEVKNLCIVGPGRSNV